MLRCRSRTFVLSKNLIYRMIFLGMLSGFQSIFSHLTVIFLFSAILYHSSTEKNSHFPEDHEACLVPKVTSKIDKNQGTILTGVCVSTLLQEQKHHSMEHASPPPQSTCKSHLRREEKIG